MFFTFVFVICVALLQQPLQGVVPTTPVYTQTAQDSVTGDNEFNGSGGESRWFVSDGADRYQNEVYERPTIQGYSFNNGVFSTTEYFQNLDIVEGGIGFDNTFIYASINTFGTNGGEGMKYTYSIRFSTDSNGRNGYLFSSEDPLNKNGTAFGLLSNSGFQDTNADVGGAGVVNGNPPSGINVTKSDNIWEEVGLNGYDEQVVGDGRLLSNNNDVFYSRVSPLDSTVVELAIDYTALGLSEEYVQSLEYLALETSKSPIDSQNYFFNDKYTHSESGSPYYLEGISTGGLGNISELDTLSIDQVPVPEPSTYMLMSFVLIALGFNYMKRRSMNSLSQ